MEERKTVVFLVDRKVQDDEGQEFKAGESYDLSRGSADHWLSRGVAVTESEYASLSANLEEKAKAAEAQARKDRKAADAAKAAAEEAEAKAEKAKAAAAAQKSQDDKMQAAVDKERAEGDEGDDDDSDDGEDDESTSSASPRGRASKKKTASKPAK